MSYDNPNFTIITDGGCNSFCNFCTDPMKRKASPDYLSNLIAVLADGIPAHFRQVSISGGEPTLSPSLRAILELIKRTPQFEKVVLTTNGARLPELVSFLKTHINHLNVSRHAIGYAENVKIFGTKDIITDDALAQASAELNKAGIDVNLNYVYTKDSKLTMQYVMDYITYAKSVGATSVSFRYDQNQNSLEPTYLEKLFAEWKIVKQGGCPVCRNHTVLVNGFPVVFKASFAEPSKAIDDVYELIYHITGKLTTDWEGTKVFDKALATKYVTEYLADPLKQHAVKPHEVLAPNSPARGKKRAPSAHIKVQAPVTFTRTPVNSSLDVGGGCGSSFGGGCGSPSVSAPVSRVRPNNGRNSPVIKIFDAGGGCGSSFGGGGCGS